MPGIRAERGDASLDAGPDLQLELETVCLEKLFDRLPQGRILAPPWLIPVLLGLILSQSGMAEETLLHAFALNEIDEGGATHAVVWRGERPAQLQVRIQGLPDRIVEHRVIDDRVTLLSLSRVPSSVHFDVRDENDGLLATTQARAMPFGWQPDVPGVGPDRPIGAAVIYRDELVVGGYFSAVGGFASMALARFDGYRWLPFGDDQGSGLNLGATSAQVFVNDLAVFQGDLYVAGSFGEAGDTPVFNIARFDGSGWHAVGETGNIEWIEGLLATEDRLYVTGSFSAIGGQTSRRIAAWDGKTWIGINPQPLSPDAPQPSIHAMAKFNGELIVGGQIAEIGGVAVNNLARFDGSQWHPLDNGTTDGVNGIVRALQVFQDHLIVAGGFSEAGGEPANRIAAWNGEAWGGLAVANNGFDGPILTLALFNGQVAAGGEFSGGLSFFGGHGSWTQAIDLFNVRVIQDVGFLTALDHLLVVSGTSILDTPTVGQAAVYLYHPSGFWTAAGERFQRRLFDFVSGFPVSFFGFGNTLLAGGFRMWAPNVKDAAVYSYWDGESWRGADFIPDPSFTRAHQFIEFQDELYLAGSFLTVNDQTFNGIARFDGENWQPLPGPAGIGLERDSPAPTPTLSMIEYQGQLVIGGPFDRAGGLPADGLARWDGETLRPFDAALDGKPSGLIRTMAVVGDTLYLGGSLQWSSDDRIFLAGFNGEEWLPRPGSDGPRLNNSVLRMTEFKGELVLTGFFSRVDDEYVGSAVRFDGTEFLRFPGVPSEAPTQGQGGISFSDFIADGDDLVIAGLMSLDDGPYEYQIIRWDGENWGERLPDIAPVFSDRVWSGARWLTRLNGQLHALASFERDGIINFAEVFAFDGEAWHPIIPPPEQLPTSAWSVPARINSAAWLDDQLMLGGEFSRSQGHLADYLIAFDGQHWTPMPPEDSPNGEILVLMPHEGWLYVGGRFTQIGDDSMPYLARWNGQQWEGIDGLNGPVHAIEIHQGEIYAGGEFSQASATQVNFLARHDGQQWHPLTASGQSPGVNCGNVCSDPQVWALKSLGDELAVGGRFVEAGNTPTGGVARWNGEGWIAPWQGGDLRPVGEVRGFESFDDHLMVASTGVSSPNFQRAFPNLMFWSGSDWETLPGFNDVDRPPGGLGAIKRLGDELWVGETYQGFLNRGTELRRNEEGHWANFAAPSDGLLRGANQIPRTRTIVPWDNGVAIAGEWFTVGRLGSHSFSRWLPEPAEVRIDSLSAALIPGGGSVSVVVAVDGEVRRPRGGVVIIESENGERCETAHSAKLGSSVRVFECELTLEGSGAVKLSARYLASPSHETSQSAPARILVGVAAELFQDRFSE
ncbi:MAG: hypothetical protein EA418_04445 [Wenzhouxiangellaceae bacterium]|nr:MAG: hypothetical protein EA418_04445 [Wenzhouxiangellaceae bacterium]